MNRPRNSRTRRRPARVAVFAALLLTAVWGLWAAHAADAAESRSPKTVLILPFDMVDTSLQGEMNGGPLTADVKRLDRTEAIVRRAVDGLDEFDVIDSAPVAEQIDEAQNTYRYLYECNGCEIDIGKAAGADLVMTGWVQKVSNLILNVNATLYDVSSGQSVGGASVDMRNNTDDSWRASALYLVKHSLLDNYHSRQKAGAKHAADSAQTH